MKSLFLSSVLMLGFAVPQHEAPALTLKDCIEVVSDYEVHHPLVPIQSPWFGWTDPTEQRIFVIRNADLQNRRQTMIHEILHVHRKFSKQALETQEEEEIAVRILAEQVYRELFR